MTTIPPQALNQHIDAPVARMQFPDGSVPSNTIEAAEGWKRHYDELERRTRENKPASLTFDMLAKANDERAKQWNPTGVNVPLIFALVELAGETGEACNVGKKLARTEYNLAGGTTDLEPLKEEIADVVICADLVARKAGFNLGEAVAAKFNATSRKRGFSVLLPEAARDAKKESGK
jgi:NTP pyrophosphatase (non-canonical NTP hydrolase)